MKRIIFLLYSCIIIGTSFAQTNNRTQHGSPIEHAIDFGNRLPHEKVYIHMDNSCYFLGDTLWYKAYVTRSDNNRLTDMSKLLYVELLTPDGFLVERQQLPLSESGNGYGAFTLKDTLYAGYYELRAYTRWQLNFGKYQHESARRTPEKFYNKQMAKDFFRDYDKLYSRVFPLYDKPEIPGEFGKIMTIRPLRRYFSKDKTPKEIKVTFYPEGGKLIAGTTGRVAFECIDHEGKHIKAEGMIKDRQGNIVADIATSFRGRGYFILPCNEKEGERYTANITYKGEEYKFALPEIEKRGLAMRVETDSTLLHIHLTARELAEESKKTLTFTIMRGGKTAVYQKVKLEDQGDTHISLPLSQLKTGVNNITLVDEKGEIFADRLFFVNHKEYENTRLRITGEEKEYTPYQPVELTLQMENYTDPAELSISVRDRITDEASFDDSNLLTEMLLGSEIKGFVETPAYYFQDDSEERKAHLDLLLMVQGWRRYVWKDMAGINNFGLSHLPEKFQTLEGSVHELILNTQDNTEYVDPWSETDGGESTIENRNSQNKENDYTLMGMRTNLKNEVYVNADFIMGREIDINDQKTQNGYFKLLTPTFFGKTLTFLEATKKETEKKEKKKRYRQKFTKAKYREEGIPEYYVKRELFFPRFVKPYSYYQDRAPEYVMHASKAGEQPAKTLNEMQWLDEVSINAKRGGLRKVDYDKPAYIIDAYEMFNNLVDCGLSTGYFMGGDDFNLGNSVRYASFSQMGFYEQIGFFFCSDMGKERERDISRIVKKWDKNSRKKEDSGGSFRKILQYRDCRLRRFDKIYIYTDYEPRNEGSWKYDGAYQPQIVIDITLFPNLAEQRTYRDRRIILQGYNDCADFYLPDYSKSSLPEVKDYRRTLYWNPVIKTDKEGKAQIRFYNNSSAHNLTISAEGITQTGIPVLYHSQP